MNPFTKSLRDSRTRSEHCPDHGPYTAHHVAVFGEVWTRCPECESARETRERQLAELERDRLDKARWQTKLENAGIPQRFYGATLSSYEALGFGQKLALEWGLRYTTEWEIVAQTGRGALLVGKPGTGKTHLAVGVAQFLMMLGHTVLMSTVQRMMRRIKATWGRGWHESETEAVAAFTRPDLLVLDEVGVQFGSDTEKHLLFDILNQRYEDLRPTILISNLPLAEAKALLGERLVDRMREAGGSVVLFDWESHRGKP